MDKAQACFFWPKVFLLPSPKANRPLAMLLRLVRVQPSFKLCSHMFKLEILCLPVFVFRDGRNLRTAVRRVDWYSAIFVGV